MPATAAGAAPGAGKAGVAAPRSIPPARPTSAGRGDGPPHVPGTPTPPVAGGSTAGGGRRRRRLAVPVLVLLAALLLAWPVGLALWADGRIDHVEARSGAADTPGLTYLLAGSDSRADGFIGETQTEGARADTIMLLHVPAGGPAALISLPRDAYVDIPGHEPNKLNAAFSWGGAPLLVQTVEQLTGLTVDHYVEIGFGGVAGVVDAVGGVELCLDYAVDEPLSGLVWTPGCHVTDGTTALAFARMRYADPAGDIGRGQRQQQLISSLTSAVQDPSVLADPRRHVQLVGAATDAVTTSEGTGVVDLARLALGFREATGPGGVRGTPWIASMDHRPGSVGSTVLLDEERNAELFRSLREGTAAPGTVGGLPQ